MDNPLKIFKVFVFIIITQYLLRNKFSLAGRKRQVWAIDLKSQFPPCQAVTCVPDQEQDNIFYKLTTVALRNFFFFFCLILHSQDNHARHSWKFVCPHLDDEKIWQAVLAAVESGHTIWGGLGPSAWSSYLIVLCGILIKVSGATILLEDLS